MQDIDPRSTKEYWDKRVVTSTKDIQSLVFMSTIAEEHDKKVREILAIWKDKKILDIACGYGRFASACNDYTGLDFSQEMLSLAKQKNVDAKFILHDAHQEIPLEKWDVVMEVISLSSLSMTADEFYERYKKYANELVICFEPDKFTIYPIYK